MAQGARVKPLQPIVTGGYELLSQGGFTVIVSNIQLLIVVTMLVLMTAFWLIINHTALGRAQRLGVNFNAPGERSGPDGTLWFGLGPRYYAYRFGRYAYRLDRLDAGQGKIQRFEIEFD